jgi:hypothetical protein
MGAAMNPKLAWLIMAILLAFFHRAEAQQPVTIPLIGYMSASGDPKTPDQPISQSSNRQSSTW